MPEDIKLPSTRYDLSKKNKLVYSEGLNTTYILSPDGKTQLGYMDGDHRSNPAAQMATSPSEGFSPPLTKESIPGHIEQASRDFVVNAASMAPLMIPGLGPEMSLGMRALVHGARIGGSLAAGYGTDTLMNPDKSSSDKTADAGLNTALGLVIPWMLENKIKIKMPGNVSETTSTTSRGPTLSNSETINRGSSRSSGSSGSSGISKSTSEGTSVGQGSGTSSGASSGSNNSANAIERTSIMRQFEDEIADTPHMEQLRTEIERLKAIEPKTKSQATQINNAIARNSDAYDAAAELNSGGGKITTIKGKGESTSANSGTRSGKSTNEQTSNSKNKLNNEYASTSSNNGESSSVGNSVTTGTSQPGDSVTTSSTRSSGHTLVERLMEMMTSAHTEHVKNLNGLQKFLAGFLGNDAVDSTINQTSVKK